ncbi:hypothetical protein Taro_045401 [Colocasia esculenta]|uniref:Uncharacterized protein n=1 Tax=Colocasia esculenta TaxID=4460 RepID=A0A843WLX9_COLES|nr:hypothetical protein [Colocasia esculenta]
MDFKLRLDDHNLMKMLESMTFKLHLCWEEVSSWFWARHHRGVEGLVAGVPLEHYKGKTFEDVVASVPLGVDPSDWQTMCQKWNTREEQDIAECNR